MPHSPWTALNLPAPVSLRRPTPTRTPARIRNRTALTIILHVSDCSWYVKSSNFSSWTYESIIYFYQRHINYRLFLGDQKSIIDGWAARRPRRMGYILLVSDCPACSYCWLGSLFPLLLLPLLLDRVAWQQLLVNPVSRPMQTIDPSQT